MSDVLGSSPSAHISEYRNYSNVWSGTQLGPTAADNACTVLA